MNKNDILKTVQKENSHSLDEREMQIELKSHQYALAISAGLAFLLMIIKIIANQPYYDLYSLLTAIMGVHNVYFGKKTQRKNQMIIGILFLLCTVMTVIAYCYDIFS